ncbi:MAG: 3-hydroxyacyl-CoA dehydrogenase NAD-binding domain-containing protein [Pseudomonadota bacterium]
MEDGAQAALEGRVAEIRLKTDIPNRLDAAARSRILGALNTVFEDDAVSAIVLSAPDGKFPAANDPGGDAPSLATLCSAIEEAPKPVAAAIGHSALGPGLDIALAAHFRFANTAAVLGYPEVRLGLVPEGGGTQRLPRLAGAAGALDVLLSGRSVTADLAEKAGFIDGSVDDDPVAHAVRFVGANAASGATPEKTRSKTKRLRDAGGYLSACRTRREQVEDTRLTAPRRMIDCVEAALLLPFEEGIALEATTRSELMVGREARALAHMSRAEALRTAPKILSGASQRNVEMLGVIGAGRMGTELTLAALRAGFSVALSERNEERLEEAVLTIIEATEAEADAGRMSRDEAKARIERLTGGFGFDHLSQADLVIEAVSDSGGDPGSILADLDAALKAGAVMALTGFGDDLTDQAALTSRPNDVIGLRLFPPMRRFRAAELRQAKQSSPVTGATTWAFLKRLARMTVITSGAPVSDRMMAAWYGAADWCLMAGATVEEIDTALKDWGARLGPFEARDLSGGGRVPSALRGGLDQALWSAGKRYYAYLPNGTQAGADPGITAILDAARERGGFDRRPVEAEEIVARALAAVVTAGAKAVRERRVARPAEVDLLAVHGIGFPRWRGGPLMGADLDGLLTLEKRMKRFAEDVPELWAPDPLVGALIKNGKRFGALNGA